MAWPGPDRIADDGDNVGDAGDAEKTLHIGGGLLGELMGEDVADLVGDDAGNLVLAVSVGYEFAGEIDAATGEAETVDLG